MNARAEHSHLSDVEYCSKIERETGRWWLYREEHLEPAQPARPGTSTAVLPRTRARGQSKRVGRRPVRRSTRRTASGDSGDDGPGEPPPALALASRPGTIYSFGCLSTEARGEVVA